MNSQEREVIDSIFERLKQAANQPRDPDADRFIADKLRAQPYAPYAMAQLIYVQEEAIKSLNAQLEQLRAELEQAKSHPSGGFLSSIFGGGRTDPPPRPQGAPQGSPWGGQGGPGYGQPGPGYAPQQGYAQGQQGGPWGGQPGMMAGGQPGMMGGAGGGGFLRGAMTTAAGVAGGMLVGNALVNAFSGHHGAAAAAGLDTSALSGLGGGSGGLFGGDTASGSDADFGAPLQGGGGDGFQDASFGGSGDFGGSDLGGGDLGGGSDDDWA
jgi:hypothetical protein